MTVQSKALKKILRSDLCAGCGLCASVSGGNIHMRTEQPGFLRPHQTGPLSRDQDSLIETICPGLSLTRPVSENLNHPIWGPIESARVAWSTDPALRHHSSSGGALSALAQYLIESGTVDFILHIGADSASPIDNIVKISRDNKDVFDGAGSRYAPSAPLSHLTHYLAGDERFAIVAKPCDIAAVRALAEHDPRVNEKIPILLSFFCAGVPSRQGTENILHALNVEEENVLRFKYRGDGWPGKSEAETKDGQIKGMSYADSWGSILSKHVQFRCKICPDGTGSFADIVCADAWHSDAKGYPIFENAEGRSLVMARTRLGETHICAAINENFIATEPFEISDLLDMQPGQSGRSRALFSRLLALPMRGRTMPSFKGFHMKTNAASAGVWKNVRNFLGTFRRI